MKVIADNRVSFKRRKLHNFSWTAIYARPQGNFLKQNLLLQNTKTTRELQVTNVNMKYTNSLL